MGVPGQLQVTDRDARGPEEEAVPDGGVRTLRGMGGVPRKMQGPDTSARTVRGMEGL